MNKFKVCAYCRVSTKQEDQENSLTSQIVYYTNLIDSTPEYVNAGIYFDHGISGKTQTRRKDFQEMIKQCRSGNIDIIYTKTIARFGRNTRETLTTLEELMGLGIRVIFETDHIDTLLNPGDIMLTIKSFMAEKEIDDLSLAVLRGWQMRMEQGKFSVNPNLLLGYEYNKKHELVIIPDEAKVVKEIFKRYVAGEKVKSIIDDLNERGFRSSAGCLWNYCNFAYIIKQEKYAGFVVMQKYITENGHRYRNNGDKRQYVVDDSVPAIVSREIWEKAQERRRKGIKYDRPRGYVPQLDYFRGKLKCGMCGSSFNGQGKRKETLQKYGNVNDRVLYTCNKRRMHGVHACNNKCINNYGLEDGFIAIFNKLKGYKEVSKKTFQNEELVAINIKLENLLEREKVFLRLQINNLMNEQMTKEYENLKDEIFELERRKTLISGRNIDILKKNEELEAFNNCLRSIDKMTKFDGEMFLKMVDQITIMNRNLFIYHLKNGLNAKASLLDFHLERDEIVEVEIC